MENQDLTEDNTQEPAYRHPKVQNLRTLKSDVLEVAQKQNKSLAQIVISSKEKKWREQTSNTNTQKVYIENRYNKPIYKIFLFLVVVGAAVLFSLHIIFPKDVTPPVVVVSDNNVATTTSSAGSATRTGSGAGPSPASSGIGGAFSGRSK